MKKKGFTLIEVLVTLTIIVILITIVIRIINPVRQRARAEDAVLQKTMSGIAQALEAYYNLHGDYPDDAADLNELDNLMNSNIGVNLSGSVIEFSATNVSTGAPDGLNLIYFYPAVDHDANAGTADISCMHATSNEDDTLFLQWFEHDAVRQDSTEDCIYP